MIKKILLLLVCTTSAALSFAQAPARRAQQEQAKRNSNNNLSVRAQISFPVTEPMPQDVAWKRDIYREINLMDNANAGLYYPTEPKGTEMNLFTYIFKLMMTGNVKAYEYRLDGNELFNDSSRIKPLAFLDNYHIYYERTGRGIRIDDSDIPSKEVKAYYIKESSYYDQNTSSFHTKVLALCPIMRREDDFGDATTPYPLFWVKYDDLAPFLTKQTMMTSNLNNAAIMSIDDFFTKNMYKGKIYKTNNMQGLTISQYATGDSAVAKEQKRIEDEIKAFEKNMWGAETKKDSTDSVATANKATKTKKRTNRRASNNNDTQTTTTRKTNRRSSSQQASGATSTRVSVRRERHLYSQ